MLKNLLTQLGLKCHKWISLLNGTAIVYITESIVSREYGEISEISCIDKARSIYRCDLKKYLRLKRNGINDDWCQLFNEYHIEHKRGITYIYVELKCIDMNVFA